MSAPLDYLRGFYYSVICMFKKGRNDFEKCVAIMLCRYRRKKLRTRMNWDEVLLVKFDRDSTSMMPTGILNDTVNYVWRLFASICVIISCVTWVVTKLNRDNDVFEVAKR